MATPGFELLFTNLQEIGFFEFLLPLVLFMAIFYGLLNKMEVLGDDESVQGAASIALAFLTTFGIFMTVPFSFFPQFFGALSVFIVLLLGILILLGLFGVELTGDEVSDDVQKLGVVGVILLAVLVFPPMLEVLGSGFTLTDQHLNFILTLSLIAIFGYVIISIGD